MHLRLGIVFNRPSPSSTPPEHLDVRPKPHPFLNFPPLNPAAPAAEKSLAEYKEKLPTAVVDQINAAIADVRGVMESENPEVGNPPPTLVHSSLPSPAWTPPTPPPPPTHPCTRPRTHTHTHTHSHTRFSLRPDFGQMARHLLAVAQVLCVAAALWEMLALRRCGAVGAAVQRSSLRAHTLRARPSPAPVPQEIKAKTQALQQAVMKIGESLAGSSSSSSSENVQDAEVKDKENK